jgi:glycosyltransferase involved in cell wall biosynthesis
MRVLFITQTAHPLGGVEVWLEYWSNALLEAGHDVTIGLVRGRVHHDPVRYMAARRLHARTVIIDAPTGTLEGRVSAIRRCIRKVQPEVVVPVNIVDVFEAVRLEKLHGSSLRLFVPMHAQSRDYYDDLRAFRGVIDFVAAASRLAAAELVSRGGIASERVEYAVCGVPAPLVKRPIDELPLRIVYAGRLQQEHKRVRDLVPLCRELDRRGISYTLDVAGDGAELPFLREALSASPHVHFLGALDRNVMYERIFPGAAALLIVSDSETGPLVAWEAMRHGAAIVTSNYRGLSEEGRLRDGETAMVVPVGDIDAFVDALQRLSDDPALLQRLGLAAQRVADRECTVQASVAQWSDALARCLTLPPLRDTTAVALPRTHGRLNRIVGSRIAEAIRLATGRGLRHDDAGAEWPHTYHVVGRPHDETR